MYLECEGIASLHEITQQHVSDEPAPGNRVTVTVTVTVTVG